jgi:hypothetical protein
MAKRLPTRPRDVNELAISIVRIATGEEENVKPPDVSERAVKGGEARAEKLSPRKRRQIAKKAAAARWKKK